MGRRGSSWISTIKRIFKEKDHNNNNNKPSDKKKKNKFPLFRAPSSIEKILGEADQLNIRPPEPSKTLTILVEKTSAASPRASSLKAVSPRTSIKAVVDEPPPTPPPASCDDPNPDGIPETRRGKPSFRDEHASATKIQAVYRGYLARRSYRALKGIVRLQEVIRSQNVRRQTTNAMKQMQLAIRIQTQIRSDRMRLLENVDRDAESGSFSKTTLNQLLLDSGEGEDWDDSLLTKEEEEARLQKKAEAVVKRERAMAYVYSHQGFKSGRSSLDVRPERYSWWWNWVDRRHPPASKNAGVIPPWPSSDHKMQSFGNHESATPRSSVPNNSSKHFRTPARNNECVGGLSPTSSSAAYGDHKLKDSDSLVSCPAFTLPRYMTPTASAMAKARPSSNPKERFPGTPDSKRRFSFPSFKGGGCDSGSQSGGGTQRYESPRSVRSSGVNSAVSMPAFVGRKPFNRFV